MVSLADWLVHLPPTFGVFWRCQPCEIVVLHHAKSRLSCLQYLKLWSIILDHINLWKTIVPNHTNIQLSSIDCQACCPKISELHCEVSPIFLTRVRRWGLRNSTTLSHPSRSDSVKDNMANDVQIPSGDPGSSGHTFTSHRTPPAPLRGISFHLSGERSIA